MLRYLPTALLHHPALTARQRELLADVRTPELHPAQLADLGRLVEAIIAQTMPGFVSYYAPIPALPPARALITDQLREENGFTVAECAAGREQATTTSPGRLLALYIRTCQVRRERQTARLRLVGQQVGRATNATVRLASELAA